MAAPKKPYKFHKKAQDAAVRRYAETANRVAAADAAGICLGTLEVYLREDPKFRARMDHAKGQYVEMLEKEALRRAVEGWDEPRMGAGGVMYDIRKFDSTLLLHLLKKKAPAEHGDSIKVDQNTTVTEIPLDFSKLSAESRRQLREILLRESDADGKEEGTSE